MTEETMRRSAAALAAVVIAAVALTAGPAAGAALPDPRAAGLDGQQRLQALIARVKIEQQGVRTLRADFVQRQESAFLLAPEESTGVFSYAAPDRVRWEYLTPKPISMVIDGKTMTIWYRDLKQVEEVKVGRYSDRVLRYLGAGGSMQNLLAYFDVAAAFPEDLSAPYRLELTPRFERVAKRLKSLTIWIDAQRFLPTRLRYVAGDGTLTEYRFEDLQINASLPPDQFHLALPEGVEVRAVDLARAP
jgi:outer membrane lipoprotein carrier protein